MAETPLVTVEPEPAAVAAELNARLLAWNERQVGDRHAQHIALSIRDDEATIVAGVTGELFWSLLYIQTLWVDEAHRGKGFGSALLQRAETIAQERGCDVAYVSTFTFQAPAFYEKCGYARFGELPFGQQGLVRVWLAKGLVRTVEARSTGADALREK